MGNSFRDVATLTISTISLVSKLTGIHLKLHLIFGVMFLLFLWSLHAPGLRKYVDHQIGQPLRSLPTMVIEI